MIAGERTWTTERIELLKSHVEAGLTCAEIAREIGVTRNAVIGKVNRLGLSTFGRAGRRSDHSSKARPPRNSQRQILKLLRAASPRAVAEVTAEEVMVESVARCSLIELCEATCRWPLSEPGARDFAFCGNRPVAGLPYCAGHARIAYRSAAR